MSTNTTGGVGPSAVRRAGGASTAVAPSSRLGRFAWFAAMVGGWIAFFVALVVEEGAIADLHEWLRALPLVVELLVWLAVFPFALAAAVWETGWDAWLRLALVASFAVGWSIAFSPWRKEKT